MVIVHRLSGLEAASSAIGATAVVDTFRAFTTAAYAQSRGVSVHMLTETVEEARSLKADNPTALLCGEDLGVTPDDFDLGNSPAEVLGFDLAGRVFIQRTSAGTRSVLAALRSPRVGQVHPASLAVATATAEAMSAAAEVSLVASGRFGVEPVIEDDITCDLIAAVLTGDTPPTDITSTVLHSDSADQLRASRWTHPDDAAMCSEVDTFDFFLTAVLDPAGYAVLRRSDP